MDSPSPKVSVVMSVYNGERYLEEAVQSILNQTFKDFEFIIVDDGSTDSTPEILNGYKDKRLRIIRQENMGPYPSKNRAIRLSRGDYIAIMDADDICEPNRLERQVEVLDTQPEITLVSSWYRIIDENGGLVANRRIPTEEERLYRLLKRENPICHGTIMVRKQAMEAIGFYNESLRYAQDYELLLSLLANGYRFYVIPEFLYRYRISPEAVAKLYIQRKCAAVVRAAKGERHRLARVRLDTKFASINQRKKYAIYHYAIGTVKLEEGQKRDARRELLKSIKLDPGNVRPWYKLALSFLPPWMRNPISGAVRYARDVLVSLRWR